eukprot:4358547-Ditylum_brightwellii.AAC.1
MSTVRHFKNKNALLDEQQKHWMIQKLHAVKVSRMMGLINNCGSTEEARKYTRAARKKNGVIRKGL